MDATNRGHVHAFLVKPWGVKELYQRISDAVDSRRVTHLTATLRGALNSRARLLIGHRQGKRVHHDMRSALSAGLLATDMARDTVADLPQSVPRETRDELTTLLGNIAQSFDYLRDLRARADAFDPSDRFASTVLVGDLLQAIRPLLPVLPDTRLIIRNDADCAIRIDRVSLTRIIANLVDNAVSFVEPGGTVEIRSRHDGRHVHIDVIDDGPGVAHHLRARVFDIMFSTRSGRDRGFGLTVSRDLARAESGDLTLLDTDGPGATFRITLPIHRESVPGSAIKSA